MYRTNKYVFHKSRISGGPRLLVYTTKNKLWFITIRRRISSSSCIGDIYRKNHHDILQVHSSFIQKEDTGHLVWSRRHLPEYVKQACLRLTGLIKGGWKP